MKLNQNRGQKTLAMWAFGASMFAVGISLSTAACRGPNDAEGQKAVATTATTAKPSDVILTSTTATPAVTTSTVPAPSIVESTKPKSNAVISSDAESDLKVKRFVVAERVEQREPAAATEFTLQSAPIYAFAELENNDKTEHKIRITFEKGTDTTVGFIELGIPGVQKRWRTWGHTRMIREPGRWTAVLRTENGTELARSEFDVKG